MPQLRPQVSIAAEDRQLEIVRQAAEEAQHVFANWKLPPLIDPKIFDTYDRIYETINSLPMVTMIKMVAEITESQNKMFARINETALANVAKAVRSITFPSSIIDAEIVSPQKITAQDERTALIPYQPTASALTIPEQISRTRSKHGLAVVAKNSVTYKRRTLKGISTKNTEGRFLIYLLSKPDLFVNDEEIQKQFSISNSRSFSWIVRNLRNKFKSNGLKVEIERRWNPDGYILINVYYLQ